MSRSFRGLLLAPLLFAGCDDPEEPQVPDTLEIAAGDAQAGAVGEPLAEPLTVRVLAGDDPVAGVAVRWATDSGALESDSSATDGSGLARSTWVLGESTGEVTATASVQGVAEVRFAATAEPGPPAQLAIAPDSFAFAVIGDSACVDAAVRDRFGNPTDAAVTLAAQDPAIVSVDGSWVHVNGEGVTTVTATAGDAESRVPVVVSADAPHLATVASGSEHSCALDTEGRAYCWGNGRLGRLGSAERTMATTPVPVGDDRFIALTAGWWSSCGLTAGGVLRCWGRAPTVPDDLRFRHVSARATHFCGIAFGGLAYCWEQESSAPAEVPASDRYVSVATGFGHACGLTRAGAIHCWGDNSYGQLGRPGTSSASPVPVAFDGPAVSVAAGEWFRCAVTRSGDTYCWGQGDLGQLGDGAAVDRAEPVQVPEIQLRTVRAGANSVCGIDAEGTAWCWGHDYFGQLGSGAVSDRRCHPHDDPTDDEACAPTPVAVAAEPFSEIAPGTMHTCGVAGELLCWGGYGFGAVGNGEAMIRRDPARVAGIDATHIAAGGDGACGLSAEGQAYCWGESRVGQLGAGGAGGQDLCNGFGWPNGRIAPHEERACSILPVAVAGAHRFDAITRGYRFACGLHDGHAYCWGDNETGQLGTGEAGGFSAVPVPVVGDHRFARLDAGSDYVCGLTAEGVAWCWGSNDSGQLGVEPAGSSHVYPTPVRVSGDLVLTALSAGGGHTCGLDPAGYAHCWGGNVAGQLGVPTIGPNDIRTTPVRGSEYVFQGISAGGARTCAISPEGYGYCWGHGPLGDGTTGADSHPTPLAGGLRWAALEAGTFHSCGIATDGAAYCWGNNQLGQAGRRLSDRLLEPTTVAPGFRLRSITVGAVHTCGIDTDGVPFCWGTNGSGQIGDGAGLYAPSPVPVLGSFQPKG